MASIELTPEQVAALCPKAELSNVVMIRSVNAGVFYGELVSLEGDAATMRHARRVWYWAGAATLSELATEGTSKPRECKFPAATEGDHLVLGVIEVIPVTARALKSLNSVPVWSAR